MHTLNAEGGLELQLRLSLFREGLRAGAEGKALDSVGRSKLNDGDFAAGYSLGSRMVEAAMEEYKAQILDGGR